MKIKIQIKAKHKLPFKGASSIILVNFAVNVINYYYFNITYKDRCSHAKNTNEVKQHMSDTRQNQTYFCKRDKLKRPWLSKIMTINFHLMWRVVI